MRGRATAEVRREVLRVVCRVACRVARARDEPVLLQLAGA